MRIANVIFVGSVAALAALAPPVLANNSDNQKTDDKQTSLPCRAYQQAPDGSWQELPCQEMGGASQPHRKHATKGADHETR
jgi:uncharacterized membrane protein YebE (DUF533 family)